MKNKKAVSLWVAWILLIAIIVAIGASVGNWMLKSTKNYVESFKDEVNSEECNYLYLTLDSICQDLGYVKAIISNPSGKSVNAFKATIFDIYGNVQNKEIQNPIYRSTYHQEVLILKDEVTDSIELVPIMLIPENDKIRKIYCMNRKIVKHKIPFCDEK